MKRSIFAAVLSLAGLSACDTPVDTNMISTIPAPAAQMAVAQSAAATCGRLAPNWSAVEAALVADGYSETTDPRLDAIATRQRAAILERAGSDVVVLVGSRGGEGACIIGLPGMTPGQAMQLAMPWVNSFDLLTNAERGQGLAENAAQAWGRIDQSGPTFVVADKTWDVLGVPGSAVRLIRIVR